MPAIIYLYIAKKFLKYLFIVYLVFAGIVFLLDIAEIIRITSKVTEISFKHIIMMSVMKNYHHFNKIWPFIILSSTIVTYRKLSSDLTLLVLKSSGFSTLQLLAPIIAISSIVGVMHATVFHSIGSYCLEKYQIIEAVTLRGKKSLINLSASGLWLKQIEDNQLIIIHGLRIIESQRTVYDFTAFYIDNNHSFFKRIDAEKAILRDNYWELYNAQSIDIDYNITKYEKIKTPTNLTFSQIIDSIAIPETLSFWQLFSFIELSKKSGFPSSKHQLYFWQLLFSPILFSSISIVAYVFSSGMPRFNRGNILVIIPFMIEFIVYFLSDFMNAFSLSGNIPMIISAIFPIVLLSIIGFYLLLENEFSD